MNNQFNYPVQLTKQKKGGYMAQLIDFPEAITQGETIEKTLNEAVDCLEDLLLKLRFISL